MRKLPRESIKRNKNTDLVNKIESNGTLADSHFFGLPVFTISSTNFVHTLVKPASNFILLPVFLTLKKKISFPVIKKLTFCMQHYLIIAVNFFLQQYAWIQNITFSFDAAFNMTYLVCPWMFSFQLASQVTWLSWRTSFQRCPAGGTGIFESLKPQYV